MLVVDAAGNDAGFLPEEYHETFELYPELRQRIILVGSLDADGSITFSSNEPGTESENFIYAPGHIAVPYGSGTEKRMVSGTSFSAPFISGLLVLLKKYFPDLDMITLKEIVLSTATPFPSYLGYGPEIAGRGVVNAYEAFMQARNLSESL